MKYILSRLGKTVLLSSALFLLSVLFIQVADAASTLTKDGSGNFTLQADDGGANAIVVNVSGANTLIFDSDDIDFSAVVGDCSQPGGAGTDVVCTTSSLNSLTVNADLTTAYSDTLSVHNVTVPLQLNGLNGDDTFNIRGNNAAVGVSAGSGVDNIFVGNAINRLDDINATVNLTGGSLDTVTFYNNGNNTAQSYTVNTTTGGSVVLPNGQSVTFGSVLGDIYLYGSSAIDTVNVVGSSMAFFYDGTLSQDSVTIGTGGSLDTIQGQVSLDNNSGLNDIVVDNSADTNAMGTVTLNATTLSGIAPANIVYDPTTVNNFTINGGTSASAYDIQASFQQNAGVLTVNGGAAQDIFSIDNGSTISSTNFGPGDITLNGNGSAIDAINFDDTSGTGQTVTFNATQAFFSGIANFNVTYSNIENYSVLQGGNSDTLEVNDLASGKSLTASQGGGADTLFFTNLAGSLAANGQAGNDTLAASTYSGGTFTVNDEAGDAVDYFVSGTQTGNVGLTTSTVQGAGTLGLNGSIIFDIGDIPAAASDFDLLVPVANGTMVGTVDKRGAGLMKITGNNSYTGGTIINQTGTLYAGLNNNALSTTGTVTINDPAVLQIADSLTIPSGVNFTVNSATNPAIAAVSPGATKTISGTVTLNTPTAIISVDPSTELILTGVLAEAGGSRNLTKNGTGTLTFSTATGNTYTGNTTVSVGTLKLGTSNGNIPNGVGSGTVTVADLTTFDVNGMSEVVGNIAGAGNIMLGSGLLFFGDNNTSQTFSGVISESGTLTKHGTGVNILSGVNTYTGQTNVTNGALNTTNASSLGTSDGKTVIDSGATVYFSTNAFTTAESFDIAGIGNVSSGALNSFSGGVHTVTGNITLLANSRIQSNNAAPMVINGVIDDGASTFNLELTAGSNLTDVMTLNGNNTYNGTTTIYGGKILFNGSNATDGVVLNGSPVVGGSGSIAGTLTLNNTAVVAPGTSPGVLTAGNTTFASTSNLNLELNGTTVGTQYDQLNSTGSVNLNNATLNTTFGFSPVPGNTFTIVQATGGVSGIFNGMPNGAGLNIGGFKFTITYTPTAVILTRLSTGSGSSGGGGGGGGGGSTAFDPSISVLQPSSLTGTKDRNQKIVCRATDLNTTNTGLKPETAKMLINGIEVNANVSVTEYVANSNANNGNANGNGNTNSNNVAKTLEISYMPGSANLYPANGTVNASCEVYNKNNRQGKNAFQFTTNDQVGSGNTNSSNTNSGSGSSNGNINRNTNSANGNNNGAIGGGFFFKDVEGHWAALYIEELKERCNVLGYQDSAGNLLNLFKPDNLITRGELAKIVAQCRFRQLPSVTEKPFPDVSEEHFAASAILRLKQFGVLQGYPDGTFRPDVPVNRAEALKIVLRSVFNDEELTSSFISPCTDVDQNAWYARFFNFAMEKKYISGDLTPEGDPLNRCRPGGNTTRAEMAKMAVNIIDPTKKTE